MEFRKPWSVAQEFIFNIFIELRKDIKFMKWRN